jgi:arylsulfatase A-like enzyme
VNTRVPLIISGTGIPKKTVSDGFVQLPDVYPTVLGHLNLEYPPVDGIDIISRLTQKKPLRSEVYFEEAQTQRAWGVRTDTHRYIRADGIPTCKYCEIPHYDGAELYNLNDDIDEKKNIINSRQGIAADLHKRMVSFFSRVNASEKKLSRRAIDSLIDVHGSRL